MQLKREKRFVQCMERVLWLFKCVKSGLQSFFGTIGILAKWFFAVGLSYALEDI